MWRDTDGPWLWTPPPPSPGPRLPSPGYGANRDGGAGAGQGGAGRVTQYGTTRCGGPVRSTITGEVAPFAAPLSVLTTLIPAGRGPRLGSRADPRQRYQRGGDGDWRTGQIHDSATDWEGRRLADRADPRQRYKWGGDGDWRAVRTHDSNTSGEEEGD